MPVDSPFYKPRAPFQATLLSTSILADETEQRNLMHLVLDIKGSGIDFREGQSLGVLPPGNRPDGRPHKLRLYSIASSRDGDAGSQSITLCVKRVVEENPDTGEIYRGVCSNFLCDLEPGQNLNITGPVGRSFLLPLDDRSHILLFATGTGVAPFRSFIKCIYNGQQNWRGNVNLFYGARYGRDLMYFNKTNQDLAESPARPDYHLYTCCSREESNPDGSRTYVQHRLAQHIEKIWPLVASERVMFYICGLIGMDKGIEEVLRQKAEESGLHWPTLKEGWKKAGRWNVEVY